MHDTFEIISAQLAPFGAQLVAVSKNHPPEAILSLYQKGQRLFGENKAQELSAKYDMLPSDIQWHMIGHLQTNKIKYLAPFVSMIESVDSLKLLVEIDKQAQKYARVIPCLLQFHIAQEETKFGLSLEEGIEIVESEAYKRMKNIRIAGVMGMASFTENKAQVRSEFQYLNHVFQTLKTAYFPNDPTFCERSMGMSSDYGIALEEGSTLVRIGALLFGERA